MIKESLISDSYLNTNLDSLAIYHPKKWLIVTAKSTHQLLLFNVNTLDIIKKVIGKKGTGQIEFNRPNGLDIKDRYLFVVERDNKRVQIISLPSKDESVSNINFVGFFGNFVKPYGISVVKKKNHFCVFVTDNLSRTQGVVYYYKVKISSILDIKLKSTITGFKKVESIKVDKYHKRIIIADEEEKEVYVYDCKGNRLKTLIKTKYDPEGIDIYEETQGRGWIVITDQCTFNTMLNNFHIFDRKSLKHLGHFCGEVTKNTDGIVISNKVGKFKEGVMFAIDDDKRITAFDWKEIKKKYSNIMKSNEKMSSKEEYKQFQISLFQGVVDYMKTTQDDWVKDFVKYKDKKKGIFNTVSKISNEKTSSKEEYKQLQISLFQGILDYLKTTEDDWINDLVKFKDEKRGINTESKEVSQEDTKLFFNYPWDYWFYGPYFGWRLRKGLGRWRRGGRRGRGRRGGGRKNNGDTYVYTNWGTIKNIKAEERLNSLMKIIGPPDDSNLDKGGYAVWKDFGVLKEQINKGITEEIHLWADSHTIKDVIIPHGDHFDFLTSTYSVKPWISKNTLKKKIKDVIELSESVHIDSLDQKIIARCHFLGANAVTIYLALQIILEKITWKEAKNLYKPYIKKVKNAEMYKKLITLLYKFKKEGKKAFVSKIFI